jgi:multidrug efflux pump subunit AcrB
MLFGIGIGLIYIILGTQFKSYFQPLVILLTVPMAFTGVIAGLFSLATGMGGHSKLWGPVATSIVWGLGFSTVLTLFLVPLLYSLFMRRPKNGR